MTEQEGRESANSQSTGPNYGCVFNVIEKVSPPKGRVSERRAGGEEIVDYRVHGHSCATVFDYERACSVGIGIDGDDNVCGFAKRCSRNTCEVASMVFAPRLQFADRIHCILEKFPDAVFGFAPVEWADELGE